MQKIINLLTSSILEDRPCTLALYYNWRIFGICISTIYCATTQKDQQML